MRLMLIILGLGGALLFGVLLSASFIAPEAVEQGAREVLRIELERRVGEKLDALSNSRLAGLARKVLGQRNEEISEAERRLREDLPRRIAERMADLTKADCACRQKMREAAQRFETTRLAALLDAREHLTQLIDDGYAAIAGRLQREFRIFTGCNAVAFLLVGLLAIGKRAAGLQLMVPAACLAIATLVVGFLYLKQDWLHTLVFGDFVGFAYAIYIGLVTLSLLDITLNRARVTTPIVNAALQVVGSALSAVPC